jgi:hypothetical protein
VIWASCRRALNSHGKAPKGYKPLDLPVIPPSVDVTFKHVTGQADAQDAQIGALDAKAGFVLGSASLLTAGLASFQDAVLAALGNHGPLPR